MVRGTPRLSGPLSPTPMPRRMRPGASSSSVAMALAMTVGWRPARWLTPGPRLMRLVDTASAPSMDIASRTAMCESVIQKTS